MSTISACIVGLFLFVGESSGQDSSNPASVDSSESAANEDAAAAVPLAGHSAHGAAYNEGPRQDAYLMGGTGDVDFPISTNDPQAQAFFRQGIGQLHGFWYYEAERSFRRVAALDPNCAMAYWGMAAANRDNTERARNFLKDALERKEGATQHEIMYIDAMASLLEDDERSKGDRRRKYIRDLEKIVREFPDDIEAKAFLAVHLWQSNGNGVPINSHQAVDSLLGDVFRANPVHPAHHYRIHLWDREHPQQALASAARCGQAAPRIAHMWHMPGHIYSRLKRYDDAVWQQEASARADHAHMMRDRVLPDQIGNYAHNNEWLIRNLIFLGRAHAALDLAKNMVELPRHPTYNSFAKKGSSSCKYGRQRLIQVLETFEMWDEVVELAETMYLEPTDQADQKAKRWRLLGVAHYHLGNSGQLAECISQIQKLRQSAESERVASMEQAAEAAAEDNQSEKQIAEARRKAETESKKQLAVFDKALSELRGLQYLARGCTEEAIDLLRKVDDVAKTRQARYEFLCGKHKEARRKINQAVLDGENEVPPLANQVDLLRRMEDSSAARKAFEQLQTVAHIADLDTPLLGRLASLSKSYDWPTDWRKPRAPATDIGDRPDLDTLGPLRWAPSPAADWSLPDSAGQTISLADFRGKPVVVIFYLGFGCLHCVEQLQAFSPMVKEFEEAEVSLVAISTEDVDSMTAAMKNFADDGTFPIPLVSDARQNVFKAYRCFDDFETMPLHGTFLIDADGFVRWQDISYEPFQDPQFLLKEASRLLSTVATPVR